MEVKRKRRRKCLPPKRRTNTYINELNWLFIPYTLSTEREQSLNNAKPAPHVGLALSWLSTGIGITVDFAILPLRWMLKLLRKTRKS